MSGQVLWFVVWCAGMYVGGCDVIVGLPVRLSEGGDLFGSRIRSSSCNSDGGQSDHSFLVQRLQQLEGDKNR